MEIFSHFRFPIADPVLAYAVLLTVILTANLLSRKIKIPSITGLIFAGILIGPHGLKILPASEIVELFAGVGILYIMFLAGLDIDMGDFQRNKNRSLFFGAVTFLIPQTIGTLAGVYILGLGRASSILMASMFASHTLISYPAASRLGIVRSEAVNITVGGTMITDTAALLVLAVIASSVKGTLDVYFWPMITLSLAVFIAAVAWSYPRLGKWFFRNVSDGVLQYIFVMALLFAAGFAAELAGVEAIIGAFLAGLALNRLIPPSSPLMNRIEFVGNALFIPFFLISVGMLINVRKLFMGLESWIVSLTMIACVMAGKWLAAFITARKYRYSSSERNVIFGLSVAQAVATLAAVLVGYNLKILNENVLNGTVLMILVTCAVSSVVVERAGRKLAITNDDKFPARLDGKSVVLVPVSKPETLENLIGLAVMLRGKKSDEPVRALSVISDTDYSAGKLAETKKLLEKAMKHAASAGAAVEMVSRIDVNPAEGIIRAAKELQATDIIVGWRGPSGAREKFFGSVLDAVLVESRQTVTVARFVYPIATHKRIFVMAPYNAAVENGFEKWVYNISLIASEISAPVVFCGDDFTVERYKHTLGIVGALATEVEFRSFYDWWDTPKNFQDPAEDDIVAVVSARAGGVSWDKRMPRLPNLLARRFPKTSFMLIYPGQEVGSVDERLAAEKPSLEMPGRVMGSER